MARAKNRAASPPVQEPAVPAPRRGHWLDGLSWLGWTSAALGLAAGVSTGVSVFATIGWALVVLGTSAGVGGLVLRARGERDGPVVRPFSAAGTLLLVGGALGLVYPCFVTRARALEVHESMPFAPLLAVSMALGGIALLVYALQREGSSEPPFSEQEEAKYARWSSRALLVISPYHLCIFLWESWRELDREAAIAREARAARGAGYDWRPILVFTTGAVCLALMEYFGHATTLRQILDHFDPPARLGEPESFFAIVRDSPFRHLTEFVWWSGWRVLGFFLIPAIVVKLVLRERLADYGLATAGFLKHAWIYVLFFGFVLLLVVIVSYEESFKTYYPFYRDASRSWYDFWAWELLYAAQFFSLEFFFRGFWLKAAKTAMGSHAIYAMVVPYCMIHFGKPFLETLAAVIAGVVLGTLALRTRSIWSGFLIHVTVAVSMDIAALLQTSGLPDRWWPAL